MKEMTLSNLQQNRLCLTNYDYFFYLPNQMKHPKSRSHISCTVELSLTSSILSGLSCHFKYNPTFRRICSSYDLKKQLLRKTSCTCDQFQRRVQLRGGWPRSTVCQTQKYKFKYFCPLALTSELPRKTRIKHRTEQCFTYTAKLRLWLLVPGASRSVLEDQITRHTPLVL